MATFTKIESTERTGIAKELGWGDTVPTTQDDWDQKLLNSIITVTPATTKYVETLCAAGWDTQSGAERAYVAQHSGACPWKTLSDKDRDRIVKSQNVTERTAARQKLCERLWDNPSGASPNLSEQEFLRATGAQKCDWSDMSEAWLRAAIADSADGKATADDPRWKPMFNAVCKRLPWERTEDEKKLLSNLCSDSDGGYCVPCEMHCVNSSPERKLMAIGAAMFLIMFIMILIK